MDYFEARNCIVGSYVLNRKPFVDDRNRVYPGFGFVAREEHWKNDPSSFRH